MARTSDIDRDVADLVEAALEKAAAAGLNPREAAQYVTEKAWDRASELEAS